MANMESTNRAFEETHAKTGSGLSPAFRGFRKTKRIGICARCGGEFEAYDLGSLSRRYCDNCSTLAAAEEEERLRQAEAADAQSRYRQLVTAAAIPPGWRGVTFDGCKPYEHQKAAFKAAKRYAESFSADAGTLVFYSKGYGSGKTYLTICIANHVLHQIRRPVLFKKARDLLLELRSTFSEDAGDTEVGILNRVLSVDLLILDDVGVDKPSAWVQSTYWTVFDRRLEWQLPTVVTANYPLEAEAGEIGLGERIGYGAVSRLVQMCQGKFIDVSGPDLR